MPALPFHNRSPNCLETPNFDTSNWNEQHRSIQLVLRYYPSCTEGTSRKGCTRSSDSCTIRNTCHYKIPWKVPSCLDCSMDCNFRKDKHNVFGEALKEIFIIFFKQEIQGTYIIIWTVKAKGFKPFIWHSFYSYFYCPRFIPLIHPFLSYTHAWVSLRLV